MSATMHDAAPTTGLREGVRRRVAEGARAQEIRAARKAEMRTMRFDTIATHGLFGLEESLAASGSLNEPLFLSPAQVFEDSDHMEAALGYLMPSWTYSRIANPLAPFFGSCSGVATFIVS